MSRQYSTREAAKTQGLAKKSGPGAARTRLARWSKYVLLSASVLAAGTPVYWMVTISLKSEVDQFATPPRWFQFAPTLAHYYDAFFTRSFGRYLITSVTVATLSTICAVTLGTLAAYGLARFRLRGKLDQRLSLWILSTR
ncbi:MAG TPA: hypothetical protein VI837_03230, partial [Blastocatellia bacterium]|nr:hypothetical protein [Blastocatellia bacterium]